MKVHNNKMNKIKKKNSFWFPHKKFNHLSLSNLFKKQIPANFPIVPLVILKLVRF